MYPIVRKEKLADNIILMDIKAPRVAKECLPGQFIIAKTDEVGERIPLTICDYDKGKRDCYYRSTDYRCRNRENDGS